MRWNVLELASNGTYLKLFRGFAVVMEDDNELGRVTLDELCCVLLTAQQTTLSKSIMVRLAELGVPIVVCGANFLPISMTLPLTANHLSTGVLGTQIKASKPIKKRLWQQLVKLKIYNQALVLQASKPEKTAKVAQLFRLAKKVKSGDPDNCEAQAARVYWQSLMGDTFRRQPDAIDTVNCALNYGYAVIRAACARAIVATGLNPSLGLHHKNKKNTFCLADDLMEIYRPLLDYEVQQMTFDELLTSENKVTLAKILQVDIQQDSLITTVNTSMQRLATSVVKCLEDKHHALLLPEIVLESE